MCYTSWIMEAKNLELVQGALFDEREVYKAIKGCDAVLSAIGGSRWTEKPVPLA